jgi:hypothetical protein
VETVEGATEIHNYRPGVDGTVDVADCLDLWTDLRNVAVIVEADAGAKDQQPCAVVAYIHQCDQLGLGVVHLHLQHAATQTLVC